MRFGTIFVLICMLIIAASVGATTYFALGFGTSESVTVALAILAVLALYNFFATRSGIRSAVTHQFADLARGGADLARQVAETSRRLAAVESKLEITLDRTRAVTDPIALEIGELGNLVKQLAETVTAQQAVLDELAQRPAAPAGNPLDMVFAAPIAAAPRTASAAAAAAPPAPAAPDPPPAAEVAPAAEAAARDVQAQRPDPEEAAALTVIRNAIEASRIDLYLQPIVTLPQRKVRYYEAMSRLRMDRGDIMHAAEFVARAESGGLMPKIDNLVVFRCVQVVRRLLLKNREIGLFCNLSASTLTDPQFSAVSRIRRCEPRHCAVAGVRIYADRGARHGADRARRPGGARRARLPVLARQCRRPAHRTARACQPQLPLHQDSGKLPAQPHGRPRPTSIPPTSPTWSAASAST